jgi:hypothetical protein
MQELVGQLPGIVHILFNTGIYSIRVGEVALWIWA